MDHNHFEICGEFVHQNVVKYTQGKGPKLLQNTGIQGLKPVRF